MEKVSYIAALITLIGFLPQTIRTIRLKETRDLSLLTFLMIGCASIFWTIYGFALHSPAIWGTNIIVGICNFTIAALKIKHG